MGVVSVLASAGIRERPRQYFCLLLLAEASANGVVVARDLFVLLLFWAAAAMPLTLRVGGWGGPRREQAAVRLLAYWGLGSVALAGAALMLYVAAGGVGFDLDLLLKASPTPRAQVAVAVALIVAAATRLPLVPFHAWARDVLAEAPVGVAVLVAGLGARLGGYLLLRLLVGGEHDGARLLAPFLAAMAGLTVAYAGLAALRRDDVRRVGAYAALVPGGITALGVSGLTPLAVDGTVLSLLAGGLVAALIVGACATVAERANTRSLALLGGLATRVPVLAWLLVLAVLAVLGVPGLASFAAQLLVVLGSFRNQPAGVLGVLVGLVLATVAMGGLLYRVLFSAPNPDAPGASEVSLSETWYLGLLAGSLIYFGVLPGGPKLAGVPIFDPGIINVLSASSSDLASPYLPGGAQAGGGTP
jgi:NADH-quinone oxidoreductase subunit M